MLCYKDQSFYDSDCVRTSCWGHKSLTDQNTMGLPVSFLNFSKECDSYETPPTADNDIRGSTGVHLSNGS